MEWLFTLTNTVFPVPARFRGRLSRDVAELSRLLTSARGERGAFYLDKSAMLTAYLRCLLPWNVYRLVRLLPSLPLTLADGDTITDLGSGPLTLPVALWIARPELRRLKLIFRCVDRSQTALDAGKKLFAALTSPDSAGKVRRNGSNIDISRTPPEMAWTIKTVKDDILRYHRPGGQKPSLLNSKSALVCAVNVYNESFWDIPHSDSRALARFAEREAVRLLEMAAGGASILVVEPGVPRSGEFITHLRGVFAALGRSADTPCTHNGPCPFPGGRDGRTGEKRKWCHFAFDTDTAPKKLRDLSAAAGIPKEKAVLSFLFAGDAREEAEAHATYTGAGKTDASSARQIAVRVVSDKFPVTGKNALPSNAKGALFGRYGCSSPGAVLLTGTSQEMDALPAGTLLHCVRPARESRDAKSGAIMLDIR
jgi:hypothetical protein